MKIKLLRPDQIITLRDYPVHNEHILTIYFQVFRKNQGKILPPCPVIHKSLGAPFIKGKKAKKHTELLQKFLERQPQAEYFLIDGGHRSAAATLAHKRVPVFIVEKNADLKIAKEMVKAGKFFGWCQVEKTIAEVSAGLEKHHFGAKEFLTVEDKVKRMVKNHDVPEYMRKFFKKNNYA